MTPPSDKAVKAVRQCLRQGLGIPPMAAGEAAEESLCAAHDPTLGLDRSVCLRDVVEALHRAYDDMFSDDYLEGMTHPADFIERELGT
jgi:hypothetical protein